MVAFNRSAALIFAGSLVLAALSAAAQDRTHNLQISRVAGASTGLRGGTGGSPYNLSCSEGQVLIGVDARAGLAVDRIEGRCVAITAGGNWTGSQFSAGATGGSGGLAVSRICPTNYVVSGFGGRQGLYLDSLTLQCRRLGSNATLTTTVPAVTLTPIGGSGGSAFTVTSCSRPARSISGRSGTYIDSMQLGCENNAPLMTLAQIDSTLAGATTNLRTDSDGGGTNDVACSVTMVRSGRVRIEPSNGLWAIDTQSEFNRACDLPGYVVITNAINWCGGLGTGIVGCAPILSSCMVVVPMAVASSAVQLWAHEFGHSRGLSHRDTSTNNIMNSFITGGTHANSGECTLYRSP